MSTRHSTTWAFQNLLLNLSRIFTCESLVWAILCSANTGIALLALCGEEEEVVAEVVGVLLATLAPSEVLAGRAVLREVDDGVVCLGGAGCETSLDVRLLRGGPLMPVALRAAQMCRM
jgi:hypothetical protein